MGTIWHAKFEISQLLINVCPYIDLLTFYLRLDMMNYRHVTISGIYNIYIQQSSGNCLPRWSANDLHMSNEKDPIYAIISWNSLRV